ncbi:hypothetical protein Ccrd_010296 [Cynara cardunculus var. scolymus]|uniref:Argonaute/Dicer protein, PAZ n=1 Tax=Cynara cardunculus var. scolymus TaxID=59895 RepID=A0A118K6W2_CYNCS|nr:hypothetical protein Ccrd_010296 [Cynara cardunculus var. scolymus]
MRLPAYDGRKCLFTAGELPFVWKEFRIKLVDEEDGIDSPKREREYKVVIRFVARVNLHHLGQFLAGKRADGPQEALQILDIVLRELSTKRYCPVGRSFFSPDIRKPQQLGEGLESWCGFYQNMASAAFIEALPVIDFVAQLLGKDVLSRPLSDSDHVKIKKALRGVKIEVTHRGNVRRKYRVSGLTSQPTRELVFPVDDNANMKSVVEYFQEISIVGQACKIVEGQRYTKRLNEKQITALLKVTCQRPKDRENDILQVSILIDQFLHHHTVQQNSYNQDPYAKEFGIRISEKLASIEARVLPAPWLKYHDTGKEKDCLPQVGQWNMMNKKVINGMTVSRWACINFSRSVKESIARGFCNELAQMCQESGMEFNPDPVIPIYSTKPEHVEKALRHVYHMSMNKLKGNELELLLIILPDNNGSLYGDIKRICETDLGLISQCCLTKYVFKISKQYLANVSLKINVKMGGRNTVLLDAISCRIPLVSDIPTIIFGADVTHPENGEDSSPSIAAVVASQDWPEVTKYAGLVCAQAHRQELIQDLYKTWQDPVRGTVSGGMIRDLLVSFRKATGQKPLRIIFYRVRNTTDKSGNILPGTVVDTKICHPTEFDFYLCSHAGIQGTSRPAHYHVLWDENNFTADGIQSLTNNLCYTYARFPPAYYAHLAAFRARFYVEPEVQENGSLVGQGTKGSRESGGVRPLPALKDNVKRVMFYC